MTEEILQLKQRVFETESPSRKLIVTYFKALIAEAKKLPVSKRDSFADEVLRPFIELANPPENDPDLDYIVFQLAGGNLDVLQENVLDMQDNLKDKAKDRKLKANVWKELIERVETL